MRSGLRSLESDVHGSTGQDKGFTIVEVLIFLAVSALILVSALTLVGGAQRRTEFNQAMRDLQQQIDDLVGNVGTGYTASRENFTCSAPGGGPPILTGAASALGQNGDCIFIGKIVQFGTDNTFQVYSVIGRRVKSDKTPVDNIVDAQARVFSQIVDRKTIRNNLRPNTMKVSGGANTSALGFFSTVNSIDGTGNQTSGAQQVDFLPMVGSGSLGAASPPTTWFNGWSSVANYTAEKTTGSPGVQICFNGPGNNQKAVITVGGGSGQLVATTLNYLSGNCP